MKHASDSGEQLAVEDLVRAALGEQTGLSYSEERINFDGEYIMIDAVGRNVDGKAVELVEIYAHQGKLKGGQLKKPTDDAARLMLAQKHVKGKRSKPKLRLAWCCDEAVGQVKRSWRGKALESMGIEISVIDLDPADVESIRTAQKRQKR